MVWLMSLVKRRLTPWATRDEELTGAVVVFGQAEDFQGADDIHGVKSVVEAEQHLVGGQYLLVLSDTRHVPLMGMMLLTFASWTWSLLSSMIALILPVL